MQKARRTPQAFLSLFVVLGLLLSGLPATAGAWPGSLPAVAQPMFISLVRSRVVLDATSTFRVQITLRHAGDLERLNEMGITMLRREGDAALVLASEGQLEDLARLRFQPRRADTLASLLTEAGLNTRAPLFEEAVSELTSLDDDADGLTNTQEQWWCTDPLNPDSDGDGAKDGVEVQAVKDWLSNKTAGYPSAGKPFSLWPPQIPGCVDDDQDSVPDMAERWELGLNMNRESTDRDKFDDGQELFGLTYCPGTGGFCGYGALPRDEDWGVIFAEMPSWVKAPGKHPLLAAHPKPGIDVIPSSLRVEAVTVVTTDHTTSEGEERSYTTAKTEGTSTSVANTVTWNEWLETSVAAPDYVGRALSNLSPLQESALASGAKDLGYTSETQAVWEIAGCLWGTKGISGWKTLLPKADRFGRIFALGGCIQNVINPGLRAIGSFIKPPVVISDGVEDPSIDSYNQQLSPNSCTASTQPYCPATGLAEPDTSETLIQQGALGANDGRSIGYEGNTYSLLPGEVGIQLAQQWSMPIPFPLSITTETSGRSQGGAQTNTHSQYEEHTITDGQAFSTEEAWGTATAVNSAHSADFWFTYRITNDGSEYAREVSDLTFNVYLGDAPHPVHTYFVSSDLGGDGKFHNFMPGEEHTYTSRRIPLTLEQMKAIDLGGPIRIVVEDYTYGIDELFYQDAVSAGVLVAMEDGADEGDETIDNYLIPTWGEETVLDVLARYFPHTTDADGGLSSLWTPEYRADTPAWCVEPQRVGTTLWCKHALSTADWWNVYTDGLGDGSQGFHDTPAAPGSTALFRFNKDSDLDGYSDRSEARLGTDPGDAASHPQPELLAGLHSVRAGDHVTATLSLLNTGLYDAYGVEAVMIAPDDTVSITNNTVGGSGRVRAQKQVVVGSRIVLQSPLPSQWTQEGHAQPAAGGYYTGSQDRTYTFTVACANPGGCDVGADTWSLGWSDGAGDSGSLSFGSAYASPNLLDVGTLGLKLGLLSGRVYNGEAFTVEGRTPRDTFQYEVQTEPHAEPVVLVSYNDPQGNHRFVTPAVLGEPTENLMPYAGEMLAGLGVEIVTREAISTTGSYTTDMVVNWPAEQTLEDAHLFLEFVDISGTVAAEVSVTVTLPPGPSVVPVTWNTGTFSPTFQPGDDYIVMAFWTDWQGNIVDTAARPLSSFQADPKPEFAMAAADETWDFGMVAQGTVLKRTFTFANTGYLDLLTYVSAPAGISLSQQGSRRVGPADVTGYEMTLNTADLPLGTFNKSISVRTSDPANPVHTVTVVGTITAGISDTPTATTQRPLDWNTYISGSHSQGEWVDFTHTLGPDPTNLHPVKVYSQNYGTLWGVGKYATAFGQGTASYQLFGSGIDGDLTVNAGQIIYTDNTRSALAATAAGGQQNLQLANALGFAVAREVLIVQVQGTGVGNYEFGKVGSVNGNTLTLQKNLANTYQVGGSSKAQVVLVPNYRNVMVQSGGTLTAHAWNGSTGGVLAFRASGSVTLSTRYR